jgi:hypothetical protein
MAQAPKLLATPPSIERTEVLGAKVAPAAVSDWEAGCAHDSVGFSCGLTLTGPNGVHRPVDTIPGHFAARKGDVHVRVIQRAARSA